MRVYVAGPMSGIPQFNFPAFDAAAARLRDEGHEVVSPAELDSAEVRRVAFHSPDGNSHDYLHRTGETWGELLGRDIKIVLDDVEAIAFLPGWEDSRGARLEGFAGLQTAHRFYLYDPEVEGALSELPASVVQKVLLGEPGCCGGCDTGEVRVTDPQTGGMKGRKLAQLGALPADSLVEVAKVAGFGAQKYERNNYLKGYAWSLSYDAMQRHLLAFQAGEDLDPESGLPHLAHAAWHCLALLAFQQHRLGTDDRWTPPVTGDLRSQY